MFIAYRFIQHLAGLESSRAYAALRRALAGQSLDGYVPAYPYIERFLAHQTSEDSEVQGYRRKVFYLVAGLYCSLHQPDDPADLPADSEKSGSTLGKAVAELHKELYKEGTGIHEISSLEQRLIRLLDSDEEQRPHLLQQMVMLLKPHAIPIHWVRLMNDLLQWTDRNDAIRRQWAKDFYRYYQPAKTGE